jgi:hypothetical protein
MDCSHCKFFKTYHQCQAAVPKNDGILAADKTTFICGKAICAICSSSFGNEEGIFRCKSHSEEGISQCRSPADTSNAAAKHSGKKKSGTTTTRTIRDPTTQGLIKQAVEVADWKSPTNFIVEDNILKQILGFDASLFNVDML